MDENDIIVPILLVDDQRGLLDVLARLLAGPSLEILATTSGHEALRWAAERDLAVAVLDVVMPGVDGFELARRLRATERARHVPILLITGHELEPDAVRRAYALGAVDYLTKPFDSQVLRAKIRVFVELFRKDRRIEQQAAALVEAERRNRELELERVRLEGQARYRSLADAIPELVFTTDPRGTISFVNGRFTEHTGLASVASWLDAVEEVDRPHCADAWEAALLRGEPLELECRVAGRDRTSRFHLLRALPERDASGTIVGWIGTLTDLDELVRARGAAQAAVALRDELVSIASHELRTPLGALLLSLRALERQPMDEAGSRKLGAALRQTKRLARMVDDLLDVARLSSGRMPLEPEPCDLADLTREVAERFEEQAAEAGCVLSVDARGTVQGRWDRLRIEQLLTNLLSNAIKYGAAQPIEVAVARDGELARVSVRDHGIGIRAEDQRRIFGLYERATPTPAIAGHGLGLFVAQQIVDAHGGSLRVASTPGEGSLFTAELPAAS